MSMDENAKMPKRAFGRSLKDFEPLSEPEKKLIDCAARGEVCGLGESAPEEPTPENIIRPELIRFLALGGDEDAPVHEKGVRLIGAYIGAAQGEVPLALDFVGARLSTNLLLLRCNFQSKLIFIDTQGKSLSLEGSVLNGIIADRMKLEGGLFLRRVKSKSTVRLNGTVINGNLDCSGGHFENEGDLSIVCDGATISGDVFLTASIDKEKEATEKFQANGEVRLPGAKISGDLVCSGGLFKSAKALRAEAETGSAIESGTKQSARAPVCFNQTGKYSSDLSLVCDGASIGKCVYLNENFYAIGEVRLTGAFIGGDLVCSNGHFENPDGRALSCDGLRIDGGLFFREAVHTDGLILLSHTRVSTLVDDLDCWPYGLIDFDGFRFERIDASSSLDAERRIAWLDNQFSMQKKPSDNQVTEVTVGKNFAIQPWMHLAKVLREQGHFREAAEVDIAREERLRAAGKIGDPQWGRIDNQGNYVTIVSSLDDYFAYFFHWLYGFVSGYGHKPRRIFYSTAFLWLFCALVFNETADTANFTLSNPAAVRILRDDCDKKFASQNLDLMRCAEQLKTYPRFSPWAYSFDLILPVVRLGQSTTWAPTWDAVWTQRLVWFEEIFGWVAALTLAAIAAGLVKRKDG